MGIVKYRVQVRGIESERERKKEYTNSFMDGKATAGRARRLTTLKLLILV